MTIMQAGRITVAEQADRNRNAAFMPGDGTPLGMIQGVQSGLVLTKTSGMGWQLDLGRCTIASAAVSNGAVVATVTVAETGSFAAGDATRDRIDIVGLQIDETATSGNGLPAVKSVVLQGAYPVSGSPVAPAIPAGTIGLWSARIAAGTSAGSGGWNTANLTDIRPGNKIFHTEFTGASVFSSANAGVNFGQLTIDPAFTGPQFNSGFITANSGGGVKVLQSGLYVFTSIGTCSANPGTSHIWGIRGPETVLSQNFLGYGSNTPIVPSTPLYCNVNDVISFGITTTNGVNVTSRVKATKWQG